LEDIADGFRKMHVCRRFYEKMGLILYYEKKLQKFCEMESIFVRRN